MNDVAAVIPAKWRIIGIHLGIPIEILDTIQLQWAGQAHYTMTCFARVLTEWNSRRCSPYTWDTIITVVQASAVGEVALANELAAKYGKHIFLCVHQR